MKGAPPPPHDPLIRQRAVKLAEEVGPNEAARQTGIKRGTISAWLSKERSTHALTAPKQDVEGFTVAARESYDAAVKGVRAAERAMRTGKSAGAVKSYAEASSKLLDQSAKLLAAQERLENRHAEIEQAQTDAMCDAVEEALTAMGVPPRIVTPVIASALQGTVDDRRAQEAKAQILTFFERELSRHGWRAPEKPSQEVEEEPEEIEASDEDDFSEEVDAEIVQELDPVPTNGSERRRKAPDLWEKAGREIQQQYLSAYRTEERAKRELARCVQRTGRIKPIGDRTTFGMTIF